ncbi:MAG TPA: 2OG-Fe(II) oxygenase [Trichormus sp.]|jgi:hypothetical protein
MDAYSLDKQKLVELGLQNAEQYKNAKPFPHIVLDNVFPTEVLGGVLKEFPGTAEEDWIRFKTPYESLKLASREEELFGNTTRSFMYLLNSQIFLEFLEKLTGIEHLIADPTFEGGGLHQIMPGGFLKIHTDFNKHSKTKLDRRLNVLIYLNENWQEEYGGHFELWDVEMKSAQVKVLPLFNRMAIFSTTDFSYHGHPEKLKCPPGMTRKSLALYYYTNGRPAEEINENTKDHNTLFQLRPEDNSLKAREFALSFVPPIVRQSIKNILR